MTYEEAIEEVRKDALEFGERMFLYRDKFPFRGDCEWFISSTEWSDWIYTCCPNGASIERLGP